MLRLSIQYVTPYGFQSVTPYLTYLLAFRMDIPTIPKCMKRFSLKGINTPTNILFLASSSLPLETYWVRGNGLAGSGLPLDILSVLVRYHHLLISMQR